MNRSRIGATISVVYALFFFCLHYFSTSVSADPGGRRGEHPFITACRTGDTDRVKTFIEQEGFDISAVLVGRRYGRFYWPKTGLHAAVEGDQPQVIEQLLAANADINKRAGYFSPIWDAARENRIECANVLIEHGAEFNLDDGRPPLYVASLYGHYEMVRLLLENGANPQLKDRGIFRIVGKTPLVGMTIWRLYNPHRWGRYTKIIRLLRAHSQPQPANETTPLLLGTSSHSGAGKL